jgi:hypothetical protein
LLERSLDRNQLRLQVRPPVLILDVHRPAEHDEPAIAVDVGLRVGIALEIVEAHAVAASANQRIERAERLDGDVLEDQEAHASMLASLAGSRPLDCEPGSSSARSMPATRRRPAS